MKNSRFATVACAPAGAFAVTLYPFDVQQQADALYEALTMPATLRRERREAAAAIVAENDVRKWLDVQLADLAGITGLWRAAPKPG